MGTGLLERLRKSPPETEEPDRETAPPPPEGDPAGEKSLRKLRAAALRKGMLRLVTKTNAVNLTLVVLLSIVAVIFLLSVVQSGVGTFTISLNRTDMYRYGIELAADSGFTSATSRLEAESIDGATNISVLDLPDDLDDADGSHNGRNYIAYTFYVRNSGTTDLDYRYEIDVQDVTRELDECIRVALYYNGGDRQIFAKRAKDGGAEPGTVPFATGRMIDSGDILDMAVGSVDKYTIVIWIEGDDPECTDDRLGGAIKMAMGIDVLNTEG